jgi:serine/threonine-protein kinase
MKESAESPHKSWREGLIGREHGNFMFTAILGEGGWGVVYLAEHKWIERKKAVKVLSPDLATNKVWLRRFLDEAVAASACHHDHIVNIEDCGSFEHEGETHYYTEMEFLEGRDVHHACKADGGRMVDMNRAVRIVSYAADALVAAHERGIVHRDVKPGNIFLIRRGTRTDYVKLLDFGVARLTGDLKVGSPTKTGVLLGTNEYMSPEQANGFHPDGKADVYSLGIVLYRMLVGKVPFPCKSRDEFPMLLIRLLNEKPPEVRPQRADVPDGISRAIAVALNKRPEERPSMVEFKEMLLAADGAPRALSPELSISGAPVAAAGPLFHSAPTVILSAERAPVAEPPAATPARGRTPKSPQR